jgi:hypothetical protein
VLHRLAAAAAEMGSRADDPRTAWPSVPAVTGLHTYLRFALLATADWVSARIAAVLGGDSRPRWSNRTTARRWEFKHNPLSVLPDVATMHRESHRDTLTWTRLGMLECPTRRKLPMDRSAFFSKKL